MPVFCSAVFCSVGVELMNRTDELYCQIYVDADVSSDELLEKVAQLVGGTVDIDTVCTANYEIDIKKNEDFKPKCRHEEPDEFVYFRYYMDVDALPGQQRPAQIALVSKLLESLWSWRFQAVAACDYEKELPKAGGYKWRVPVPV